MLNCKKKRKNTIEIIVSDIVDFKFNLAIRSMGRMRLGNEMPLK